MVERLFCKQRVASSIPALCSIKYFEVFVIKWSVESRKLSELKAYEKNPRRLTEKASAISSRALSYSALPSLLSSIAMTRLSADMPACRR